MADMAGPAVDFGFGFNDTTFSDRVLRIELIPDCVPNRKRGRNNLKKKNVVEAKTWHINSLILAANSPFFFKLFKNGMKESQQREVTLKINASEEAPLMDIIKFMYSNTLSTTSLEDLLGVLMVADKFEVTSCMSYCSLLLQKMPISLESALRYIELHGTPSGDLLDELVQPKIIAARAYLVAHYSDFNKSQEEMMDLPLCALEVVLGSDGLHVDSEDEVFDYILKWARAHYPKLKERREILTNRLVRCICFPNMSCSKLKEVLVCPDFGHEQVSKLVLEALFLKVDVGPNLQQSRSSKYVATTQCSLLARIYKYRPFQVVQSELSQSRCAVYFDLKKEECKNLLPSGKLFSPSFSIGERSFYLSAERRVEETFGVFVWMTKESENCTLEIEFTAMKKHSKAFQNMRRTLCDKSKLLEGWGFCDLFRTTWSAVMSKGSDYFIDGILHLRVDLTIIST